MNKILLEREQQMAKFTTAAEEVQNSKCSFDTNRIIGAVYERVSLVAERIRKDYIF